MEDSFLYGRPASAVNSQTDSTDKEIISGLCRAKLIHRRELAALPFEKKIRIVVELQKIAETAGAASGKPGNLKKTWKLTRVR